MTMRAHSTATLHRVFVLLGLLAVLAAAPAQAAPPVPYDQTAFESAQAAGKPILVAIAAPWCPICKAQKPIIDKLAGEDKFKQLAVFTIDFDTQRDLVRQLGARSQSTLIAFKGKKEVGRSVGETQPEWIENFLEQTL